MKSGLNFNTILTVMEISIGFIFREIIKMNFLYKHVSNFSIIG